MRPIQSVGNPADHGASPWRSVKGMPLHRLPRRDAAMILVAFSQGNSLHRATRCLKSGGSWQEGSHLTTDAPAQLLAHGLCML